MATVDNFLKIDGVDGESTDDTHKAEIEVLSWTFGGSNAGSFDSNSGGGTGKVSLQDFTFTAYTSKFFLRPHYQLEGLTVSLRLVSKLPSAKAS